MRQANMVTGTHQQSQNIFRGLKQLCMWGMYALLSMLSLQGVMAQTTPLIVAAEYFFDTDPGDGNGTSINIGTPDSVIDISNLNIPLNTLTPGTHRLYIRVKNDAGVWSLNYHTPVLVNGTNTLADIDAAEYFFDNDPGFGNATPWPGFTPGTSVDLNQNIPLTGLTPGTHRLYVRTRNTNNQWSLTYHTPIIVDTNTTSIPTDIVATEYFWDNDPGYGNGIAWPVATSPATVADLSTNIPLTGLTPGYHRLHVRSMNSRGQWSLNYHTPVIVDTNTTTTKPNIIATEYFWDTDPGYGNGTPWPNAITPNSTINLSANLPLNTLNPGLHRLHVRSLDENGLWTLNYHTPVLVEEPHIPADLVGLEYFWDTDPGFGNGTYLPFSNPDVVVDENLIIAACGMATGTYKLYFRTKNANGQWSHVYYSDVSITNNGNGSISINVSNNGPKCEGDDIQLTVTGASGSTTWSGPNGFTSTAANPVLSNVANTQAGWYKVTVDNGCAQATDSTLVTIDSAPTINITGNTSFCIGGNTTLTASGGTGYSWSTGDNTASTTINTPGTYTVTVVNATGCANTATATVSHYPAPTASITGLDTICPASSSTFTASAGSSYNWSTGASTQSITVSAAGTYYVTVTDANGCSATASRDLVTQGGISLNAVITGADSICAGTSTTLTASGGTVFNWSTGANTQSITVSSAGTYSVTVSTTGGCSTPDNASHNLVVMPNPTAAVSGQNTICDGDTTTLTASGGNSYLWSTGASTPSIEVTSAGTYSVTASTAFGCTASNNETVTVNSLPTAAITGVDTISPGGSSTFTASGGTSYQWSTGASTPSISVSAFGTYTVTVTNASGCTDTASKTLYIIFSNAIIAAEYFWDTDPGYGNGAPLSLAPDSVVDISTNIPLTGLSAGPHRLHVRTVNNDGEWSLNYHTLVIVDTSSPVIPEIIAAEYFWDTDPGYGNGTAWPAFTAGMAVDLNTNIPLTGLTPGVHRLHVRTLNNVGQWTLNYHTPVIVDTNSTTATPEIIAAEYFWDTDPGYGNGSTWPAFTPNTSVNLAQNIPLTGLTPGIHRLHVRTLNSKGQWTLNYHTPVIVDTTSTAALQPIVATEYFWDTDPGFGNGTPWPAFTPNTAVDLAQNISLTGLSAGLHRLYARSKRQDGTWSLAYHTPVIVIDDTLPFAPKLVSLEYFWDTDPGFGNGTAVSLTQNAVVEENVQIDLCGLADGVHKLYVRAQDELGKWSHVYYADVNVTNTGGGSGTISLTVTSNGPVCEGATGSLQVNTITNANYAWTGPNGFTSNSQNPNIANATPAETGYYVVSVSDGCGNAVDSAYLDVRPAITLTNWDRDTSLCMPDTVLIAATNNITGANYNWSNGAVTPSIDVLTGGTYQVTVTDAGAVCETIDSIKVSENVTFPRVWTGGVGTYWGTHQNWTCGGVPDGTVDVQVPDVSGTTNNHPVILQGDSFEVKTLYMMPGSELILDGTLRVLD